MTICGIAYLRAQRGRGPFHRDARADHDQHRGRRDDRIAGPPPARMDGGFELELLLGDCLAQPVRPRGRKAKALEAVVAHAQHDQVRDKHRHHQDEAHGGRDHADDDQDADDGD